MTWKEYPWPSWVPLQVRAQIEDFWGDGQGRCRCPKDWMDSASREPGDRRGDRKGFPLFMERARARRVSGAGGIYEVGAYVYAWGNIGLLVLPDGQVESVFGAPRTPPPVLPPRKSQAWRAARAARLARARLVVAAGKGRTPLCAAAVEYSAALKELHFQLMLRRVRKAERSYEIRIKSPTPEEP